MSTLSDHINQVDFECRMVKFLSAYLKAVWQYLLRCSFNSFSVPSFLCKALHIHCCFTSYGD